jgi:hypothetical protein
MKLKVTWSKTPATFGKFDFSGDTVEWSSPDIKRPQSNVRFSDFARLGARTDDWGRLG